MKPSSRRIRRALWLSATAAAVAALTITGVSSSVAAQPTSLAGTTARGPGYPPPRGVYAQYTNCPLNNPLMHEAITVTVCTAGLAKSGSITIGNITTPVTQPVNVQFGWYDSAPVTFDYPLPTVSPLAGPSAILSTKPDLIPGSLTTELGCPSSNATVENICQQAAANPADNQVFALAQEVGPITNFRLFTWTQPVIFKLINPLLGSNCTIGTPDAPVMINPQLSFIPGVTTFTELLDPQPTVHPSVAQLLLTGAQAGDSTFSAPGVSGCGPDGVANIAVETALDAGTGLPAASGNSLTLFGNFDLAIGAGPENFPNTVPQPADAAAELLAAFKASTNGEHSVKHLISESQFKAILHFSG